MFSETDPYMRHACISFRHAGRYTVKHIIVVVISIYPSHIEVTVILIALGFSKSSDSIIHFRMLSLFFFFNSVLAFSGWLARCVQDGQELSYVNVPVAFQALAVLNVNSATSAHSSDRNQRSPGDQMIAN